ncbi:methionine ABC transporter permease [Paenibacillus cremeus]|uniref:ABC transporter permease n=1 Tax=Paenibacillus cremeus TaxID=2163881 RepID=A0A559JKG2_9BACL|nr:methionine ABC transporter permease [Paenibacillus cremeus]TVY00355.1 ABC transporter permease [Paenibacillus cremeus]
MDSLLNLDWSELGLATSDTLMMLVLSTLFTVVIGLPLGIVLFVTARGQLTPQPVVYAVLSFIVNVLRSVPFIILMILVIPFTKLLVGTSIGVPGTIPPLVIAAAPFFARLVETSLREVDRGVIEAAQSMGATYWQIVRRVLLPEARPGLVAAITITAVTLVSYTAMSGAIGGGGLGDLAIRYGYLRFQTTITIVTVLILLALVQILQSLGDRIVRKYQRK